MEIWQANIDSQLAVDIHKVAAYMGKYIYIYIYKQIQTIYKCDNIMYG